MKMYRFIFPKKDRSLNGASTVLFGNQENYNDYLEPYVGRVEYYSQNDDEALRGRVKYIGKTLISYYPSYEIESLRGKLKSIGSVNMDITSHLKINPWQVI